MTTTEPLRYTDNTAVHPWERACLGRAPFRFTGMTESVYQACQGAPIQPGSSCDYCGNGIRYVFHIASADGRSFKVGIDCVRKVGDSRNRVVAAAERAQRDHERKLRAARADAKEAKLAALLADEKVRALLAALPHPIEWRAQQGATRLDWAEWMLKSAGAKGQAAALKAVETVIARSA